MIHKPQPGEYAPFANTYVSLVHTTDVLELMESLKDSTYKLFSNMTEQQAMHTYAEGKWTLKQVLGHMIDTERTFAYRAFVFSRDSTELPGFDQDVYMSNTDFNSRSIRELAEEFRLLRASNLHLFKAFTEDQLLRVGIASNNPATVRALVYMTVGHELHHLNLVRERYL